MEGPLASGALIALETGLIAGAIAILAVSYNGTGKMVTATNTQENLREQEIHFTGVFF